MAASFVAVGCAAPANSEPEVAPPDVFPVANARVSETTFERAHVAEIRAVRYAEVRTRVKGIVEKVLVDEGQAVKAGQLLFTINARDLTESVAAAKAATLGAEAELRAAELERQSTQLLFDKNVVASAELELARAKVQALEAKVAEWSATAARARVELGYARVTAPFDGVVNRIPHKAGSAVSEEALLTTVADTSSVYAYFRVSEQDYLQQSAQPDDERPKQAWLELADGSAFPEVGVIDAVENEFDPQTGSIAFRAKFPNPSGLLKHGAGGKVVLKTQIPNALLVPQQATFEIQGDLFVYAVDEDNVARARKIAPKLRVGGEFVLDAGLTADERFVLEGVQKLRDGAKIQVAASDAQLQGS